MTFSHFCIPRIPRLLMIVFAFALGISASAQVRFYGTITTNTAGASAILANPVYYNQTVTAVTGLDRLGEP